MKKAMVIVGFVLASLFFVNNVFAGSWGATQLEYLTVDYPSHIDEFSPGCSGNHQIQFWANATIWDKLEVTYYWRNDASPSWTSFYTGTYSTTGYQTVNLYAGTSDVDFMVVFSKKNPYYSRTMTVSWRYYTDN